MYKNTSAIELRMFQCTKEGREHNWIFLSRATASNLKSRRLLNIDTMLLKLLLNFPLIGTL